MLVKEFIARFSDKYYEDFEIDLVVSEIIPSCRYGLQVTTYGTEVVDIGYSDKSIKLGILE